MKQRQYFLRAVIQVLVASLGAMWLRPVLGAEVPRAQPGRDTPGCLAALLARPPAVRACNPVAALAAAAPAAPEARPRVANPAAERLRIVTHHSLLLETPHTLARVAIADNTIADAVVVAPQQVLVEGRAPGEVSLLLWDSTAQVSAYTVEVDLDPEPLQRELSRLFPHQPPSVSASGNALVLSGVMPSAALATQALAVAAGYAPKVVNDLSLEPAGDPAQVLLQVRFAEVDRSVVTDLGVNLLSNGKGMVGAVSTQQFGAPITAVAPNANQVAPGASNIAGSGGNLGLNDLMNIFLFNRGSNLGLTLKALEQRNLLQILAEPNLLAMDGKEASFLAGGEFPFPVVQGQGSVNNVTIQFKPFGVNLHFKPTVMADGTIDLEVAPEVSALDFTNALTVSGFLIPALSTRRAETELELADGQSFVIAGLLDNRLTNNLAKVPGLANIPVLGKLFESKSVNRSRNELLVVVTAHLVRPSATAAAGPRMPQPFLTPAQFDHGKGNPQ